MGSLNQIAYCSCYWWQGLSVHLYKACALNLKLAYLSVGCSKEVPSNKVTSLIRIFTM